MNNDNKAPGSNIVSLAEARQRREEEEAPFEMYGPQAQLLQGDDHVVTCCDGEQHYVFMLTKAKRAKTFKMVEVYPGLTQKSTPLRGIETVEELTVPHRFEDIDSALEWLDGILFEDVEMEEGATLN